MQLQTRLDFDLNIPDKFGYWFAGFTDGEAYFGAIMDESKKSNHAMLMYRINLRADDAPLLFNIWETLGQIGRFHSRHPKPSKPQVVWTIRKIGDLQHIIVPLFEKYPLESKKSNDFKIWKQAVEIAYTNKKHRPWAKESVIHYKNLCIELKAVRKYNNNAIRQFNKIKEEST